MLYRYVGTHDAWNFVSLSHRTDCWPWISSVSVTTDNEAPSVCALFTTPVKLLDERCSSTKQSSSRVGTCWSAVCQYIYQTSGHSESYLDTRAGKATYRS
jgi:hypothetical protein